MSAHSTLSCSTGKVSYSSKASADKEVRRIDDVNVTSFKCAHCGKWHVGHQKTSEADSQPIKDNGRANRVTEANERAKAIKQESHLAALETKQGPNLRIELPPLDIRTIRVRIVGDSPLICHKWSEKAKSMMRDKQMGKASSGREHKNPQEDYEQSLYRHPDGGYGVPSLAFKNCAVTACTSLGKSITKVAARQAFHIIGPLIKIEGEPSMREDMVRVGMGTADIRYRGEFKQWACVLVIRYNARVLTDEQIVNLMNTAGFAVGICEWRPECNGESGTFHVE